MNETAKSLLFCVIFSLGVCVVAIGLLMLGAWLDASATGKDVIIKLEKVVTCEPTGKGWVTCKEEWI
jgi:hypothetical protein